MTNSDESRRLTKAAGRYPTFNFSLDSATARRMTMASALAAAFALATPAWANNITISSNPSNAIVFSPGIITTPSASGGNLQNTTLVTQLNSTSAITVKTANGGNILVNVPVSWSVGSTLTLDSNGAITADDGRLDGQQSTAITLQAVGAITLQNSTAISAPGGAIRSGGTVTLTGSQITLTNNHVTTTIVNGGAIYATGNIYINGALTASGNTATGTGGVLHSNSVNIVQDSGNVNIHDNQVGGSGGAIYVTNGVGSVNLANTSGNVTLQNNIAGSTGGAIYSNGTIVIGNANAILDIQGNRAGFSNPTTPITNSNASGGALMANNSGTVTLTGSSITLSDNIATQHGGGIYSSAGVTINGNLTAEGNKALNGAGGAIFANGALGITGALTATGNTAKSSGGALYAASGTITQNGGNVDIQHNQTTGFGSGGAIYADGRVSLAATSGNVTLANNIAGSFGGAIYALGTVTIGNNLSTLDIQHNRAGYSDATTPITGNLSNGGAIFSNSLTTLTASSITLSDNIATLHGGGIFSSGTATINGNLTAENNWALGGLGGSGGLGGAIYSNSNINIATTFGSSVTLNNNIAGSHGGAIYAANGTVTIGNSLSTLDIQGNRAG
ncbi:MAG: hypothetical protein LBV44_03110, partial [Methylobacillus sp.]|nr:hypothetical protein [Methylobacillus sp.]